MKTLYFADDGTPFATKKQCRKYEAEMMRTVAVPVKLIELAIAQATPYMVSAADRRELKSKLEKYLVPKPESESNAEVSASGVNNPNQ